VGMTVTGTGIPAGATITAIGPTAGQITISANATATGTPTLGLASFASNVQRTFAVTDSTALQVGNLVQATITGSGDIVTAGTGNLSLSGNNSSFTGSIYSQNAAGPGQGQGSLTVGSATALGGPTGSGVVFAQNTVNVISGTVVNGSPIVTNLSSTRNLIVGAPVIVANNVSTTIKSIDSLTQITLRPVRQRTPHRSASRCRRRSAPTAGQSQLPIDSSPLACLLPRACRLRPRAGWPWLRATT